MRKLILVALLLTATAIFAADPAEEVRQAEIAFARAFADRDAARFFAFVADDATFMGPRRTLSGKAEVIKAWTEMLADPKPPFRWEPQRVAVNAAGDLGLSTGPIHDAAGNLIGNYSSIWQKRNDGSWKIVFDGPGSGPPCAQAASAVEEGFVTADDGARLYYRKVGNAPQTVIVPLDYMLFDDFKQLADQVTVITYDMRNRGRSSHVEKTTSLSIKRDVMDLEAVRQHFKLDRFVPVGFSYLGKMVAMYAMQYPSRVERMIQIAPVQMNSDTKFPQRGYDDVAASAEDVKKRKDMVAHGFDKTKPHEFCEADWRVFQYVLVGEGSHAGRLHGGCDFENEWPVNLDRHFDAHIPTVERAKLSKADLGRVTMPVLVIHGTKDRNAPYEGGKEWSTSLPNARLLTVPDAAHAVFADAPEIIFPAIREFLKGN